MSKLRIIVGLPGSGKTYYAEHNPFGLLFDDPASNPAVFKKFRAAIKDLQDVTVTDTYMVDPATRRNATQTISSWVEGLELEWIYFANEPEACIANVILRDDDRVISPDFIKLASKQYIIPEGVEALPVYEAPPVLGV